MNYHEQSLGDMLASADGRNLGHAMIAHVASGNAVTVKLVDGGMLTLTEVAQALRWLRTRYGWEPGTSALESARGSHHVRPSDLAAGQLFEMCQRMGGPFTMQAIIARVLHEQPRMIFQFAEVWAALIAQQRVKMHQSGETNTYEITTRDRS